MEGELGLLLWEKQTSDFVFLAVFVKEAPEAALWHALYFWEVIECGEGALFISHIGQLQILLCVIRDEIA
jgi:hypothetical protein